MILTPMLAALAAGYAPTALTGTWQYQALNEEGKVIAQGTMTFRPAKEKDFGTRRASGWSFFGTRQVTCTDSGKYGPHSGKDMPPGLPKKPEWAAYRIGANLKEKAFTADLNEGWSDNNIILNGTLAGKTIKGTWYWGTFAGARVRGTFTLMPPPKRVH